MRSGFAPPPAKAGGGWEGVPTVRADLKDTPPQPSPAFAGEGAGSDAHGTHAARSRSAVSNAIGPSGSPRRNCSTSGSPVASSSDGVPENRSEEHTSELQSLMRISYAVFCL